MRITRCSLTVPVSRPPVGDYWPRHGKIEFCGATIGYLAEPTSQLPTGADAPSPAAAGAVAAAVGAAVEAAAEVAPLTAPEATGPTPVLRDINLTIEPGQKVS